ncbi:hypothetical protein S40288_06789 [Stachybotrys chartarum IBT 40288]|nr:hypothetical protein S40288_06789 [Stachybotrys chartarum IBT 40288]
MPDTQSPTSSLELPRPTVLNQKSSIEAPSYEVFTSRFGHAFPKPQFLNSNLGTTALYDLPAPSGQARRHVLVIHGVNTPALGLWPLAKELQALDPDAHIVLFDLWGHGLSSTPLVAHAPHVFHFQILQVLAFMQWTHPHVIGYSFGASTAISFALDNPWVASVVTLAPAGIIDKAHFSPHMEDLLDSQGRDPEAIDCVMNWLEGGPINVPDDWQQRVQSGHIVAEALREWELQEHPGYPHSVLSMFRYGGVYGREDTFREFAKLPFKKMTVLGELDIVCTESQLRDLGFSHVEVVKDQNHGLVRTAAGDVAKIVHRFWSQ